MKEPTPGSVLHRRWDATQNLIWDRTRHINRLRSDLREYFPAALVAFDDLAHPDAIAVLSRASGPGTARRLSRSQIRSALKRGGRTRYLDQRSAQIYEALRSDHLNAPTSVEAAFAATTASLVKIVAAINSEIETLQTQLHTHFEQHPDAEIYRSLPGLGPTLGARVLSEFGDDPERYDSAKSRRNYAGTAPITVASGNRPTVRARHVRNRRLYDAVDQWAFCSITKSSGCQAFYHQRRAAGDGHHQALRALGNRLVGYLHGCLASRTPYDEHTAWAHREPTRKSESEPKAA